MKQGNKYTPDHCDTCKYCKIQHVKRDLETYWKCRLLKFKQCWDETIKDFSVHYNTPSWCPLNPSSCIRDVAQGEAG